jgi:phospholipase/carboxylesterase
MSSRRLTRRDLLRIASGAIATPLAACAGRSPERLVLPTAVPSAAPGRKAPDAVGQLGLGGERDAVLAVPPGRDPAPLLVMLHGAGGTGRRAARIILPLAEACGCVVLAPDSRGATWDAITGGFGPDVRFLERALGQALARRAVDPTRIAAAGFSDGATYALALGRANGDLFSHLIAFSPGFLVPVRATGTPRIFVSHGRQDRILPIDSCSRRLVPVLRRARYDVRYREFDGQHEVPAPVARDALEWFTGTSA